jgi:type VI protein secretion system component VasF
MIGGYTERASLGQKAAMPRTSFAPVRRRRRSPVGMILLLLLVLFVGFLIWLGLRSSDTPVERMERDVTNEVLAR